MPKCNPEAMVGIPDPKAILGIPAGWHRPFTNFLEPLQLEWNGLEPDHVQAPPSAIPEVEVDDHKDLVWMAEAEDTETSCAVAQRVQIHWGDPSRLNLEELEHNWKSGYEGQTFKDKKGEVQGRLPFKFTDIIVNKASHPKSKGSCDGCGATLNLVPPVVYICLSESPYSSSSTLY
ncbi:hypothetical protein FIBSPDRAFT_900781 [Athelia psychrophila]|uniref:Uncharacterized protein n=1 Tax=Athelia psychrophila TaxID=1759441 RepID=A0A165XZZ4_9AGAM|nr:hypothetical protein FIBSPDRAFT_900781 [Fibularhizoctonia sp. CBS 109695]